MAFSAIESSPKDPTCLRSAGMLGRRRSRDLLVPHRDPSGFDGAEIHQRLGQLRLAVAVDARNAEDLAGVKIKAQAPHCAGSSCIAGHQALYPLPKTEQKATLQEMQEAKEARSRALSIPHGVAPTFGQPLGPPLSPPLGRIVMASPAAAMARSCLDGSCFLRHWIAHGCTGQASFRTSVTQAFSRLSYT